jgi:WD40 repeat protein
MNALILFVNVFFFPASELTLRATLQGHAGWVEKLAFSGDGRILASVGEDGNIKLWDVAQGTAKNSFQWTAGTLRDVALSADGKLLAAAGGHAKGEVRIWDAVSGKQLGVLNRLAKQAHSVAFSPDGTALAWGSADGTATACEIPSLKQRARLQGHTDSVESLSYLGTGELVSWSPGNAAVIAWDMGTGKQKLKLEGCWSRPTCDKREDILAALGQDNTIGVCTLGTGRPLVSLKTNAELIDSLSFSPDGRFLACAGWKHDFKGASVDVYELATRKCRTVLRGKAYSTNAFSPDGKTLATGGLGNVKLWDFAAQLQ